MKYCSRCEARLSNKGNPWWNHQCPNPPDEQEKKEIFEKIKEWFSKNNEEDL